MTAFRDYISVGMVHVGVVDCGLFGELVGLCHGDFALLVINAGQLNCALLP